MGQMEQVDNKIEELKLFQERIDKVLQQRNEVYQEIDKAMEACDFDRVQELSGLLKPYVDITQHEEAKTAGTEGKSVMKKLSVFKEKVNVAEKENPKRHKEATEKRNNVER